MIGNNNPNFLEFARLVSRKSFHYLITTIRSIGAIKISIRRIRDEKPYTYFDSSFDDIADERKECLLWRFFNARREELFKPGFPYNGTCGSIQGRVRLRYPRRVLGTAGRVQSCLRYHRYRTVRENQSHESLMEWSSS